MAKKLLVATIREKCSGVDGKKNNFFSTERRFKVRYYSDFSKNPSFCIYFIKGHCNPELKKFLDINELGKCRYYN